MKRIIALAPVFIALALASHLPAQQDATVYSNSPQVPAQAAPAQGMRQIAVSDPKYNITAYTIAIPADWRFGGEIVRSQGCHSMRMGLNYKMESPDSLTAIIQLLPIQWHWDNDEWTAEHMRPPCDPVEISSAADFLINILLPEVRPNAKVVGVVPPNAEQRQSLAQQEDKARQNYTTWAQQAGAQPPQHVYVDGTSVRLQYDLNGQPVEELVTAVITCYGGTSPNIFHPRHQPHLHLPTRAHCARPQGPAR
jgi:hypothetical protein